MAKRKPWFWEDENYSCKHPYAVHDGPGQGVHCVFCQTPWSSYEIYEQFIKQYAEAREHTLVVMFDAV